jgi:hypothetical protein
MKRFLFLLSATTVLLTSIASCAVRRSMKRDCNGVKHVRPKNGIYI